MTPHRPVDPQPLRNIPQAAAWLGIGEYGLRKLVAARRVPHTRIGRNVRFTQEDLDRIAATGHVEPRESVASIEIRRRATPRTRQQRPA